MERPRLTVALAAGITVLALGACSVSIIAEDVGDLEDTTAAFLDAVRDGDLEAAYKLLEEDTRERISLQQFAAARQDADTNGRGVTAWDLEQCQVVSTGRGSCSVTIANESGLEYDLSLGLREQDGDWLVHLAPEG